MPSDHENFWKHSSYVFVGHSAKKPFPKLSFGTLKQKIPKVFAVDPSVSEIEGEKTYPDLASLPEKVEAAVLETPREETASWVKAAADAGIKNVWIHMKRDTPEVHEIAKENDMNLLTGTCAVMYVKKGFPHVIHRGINKLLGKY